VSGVCAPCVVERVAELYAERDRSAVQVRWVSWGTSRPDHEVVRLRQQRHRLREAVRPETPAPPGTDPWVLGAEAVRLLTTCDARSRERRTASRTWSRPSSWCGSSLGDRTP